MYLFIVNGKIESNNFFFFVVYPCMQKGHGSSIRAPAPITARKTTS